MLGGSPRGVDRLVVVLVVLTVVSVGLTAAAGGSPGIGTIPGSPHQLFADDNGEPPLADAGLDQHAQINETVYLDAGGSYAPEGDIESYEWTIEAPDNTTFQPDPHDDVQTTFVPQQNGTYNVTVTVTATNGLQSNDTLFVEVSDREPPTASLDGPETIQVDESATLELDANWTTPLMAVSWYVDDDLVNSEFLDDDGPWHTAMSFDQPGEYILTAEVVDESGLTANGTHDLTVLGEAPFFDVEITNTNRSVQTNAPLQAVTVVENTGEEPDTQDILVQTDEGHVLASFERTLDPGESATRTATLEPCLDTDIDAVSIHSEDDSDEQAVTVTDSPCAEPFFAVDIDDVGLSDGNDTELEIDATVENVGEVADTQDVRLEIEQVDGLRDQVEGLHLPPGHSDSITLELEESDQYSSPYEVIVRSDDDVATDTFEYGNVVEDHFVVIHESDEWFGQGPAEGETVYMHPDMETQIGIGVGEFRAEWEDVHVDRTVNEPDNIEYDWIDSQFAWQQTGLIENNWAATEYLYRTPTVREDGTDAYDQMPHIAVESDAETGVYEMFCVIGYPELNDAGSRPYVDMESSQDHWYTENWADEDGPSFLYSDCVEVGIIEEEEYDEMMGADLEVEVVNYADSPLSGAEVWSDDWDGFSGTTGEDGTVAFDELEEGDYTIEVEYDGEYESEEIYIENGTDDLEITIEMDDVKPTGTLDMTVIDEISDDPVEGAYVVIGDEFGQTDANGEVEIEVETGYYDAEVIGDADETEEHVVIYEDFTTEETVYLEETTTGELEFRVRDQHGDDIEGAEVVSNSFEDGETNSWGRYEVDDVDAGTHWYSVDYNGIEEAGTVSVQAGDNEREWVTMDLIGSLEVTVLDSDTGERIEGVDVYETNGEFSGVTDSSGEVSWDDIDEGSYDVYIDDVSRSVDIEAGETTTLYQHLVRRGTLEVHVMDQYLNDISGAEVEEDVSGWFETPEFSGETGWDGTVVFDDVPQDSYDVIAMYAGEEATEEGVDIYEDETTEITMIIYIDNTDPFST